MQKNIRFIFIIIVILYACTKDRESKLKRPLFDKPVLLTEQDQNLTLYSNNPYDINLNYSTPCGYKQIDLKSNSVNVFTITTPEKDSKSGKIILRIMPKNSGEDILEISLTDNCNQTTLLNFYLSIQESLGYSGLLANYSFSLNAEDKSGKENHGEVHGATLTKDRYGNNNSAYKFDGIDDYIIVPNEFFNIGNDYYTISGWFSIDNVNIKNQNILNSIPSYGLSLDWNTKESPFVVSFSLNDNPDIKIWNIVFGNGVLASVGKNKWHHFLFQKKKNIWDLYIDGVGNSFLFNLPPIKKNSGIIFGKNISSKSGNVYFKGKLDDFYFFDRILTPNEIKFLKEN